MGKNGASVLALHNCLCVRLTLNFAYIERAMVHLVTSLLDDVYLFLRYFSF